MVPNTLGCARTEAAVVLSLEGTAAGTIRGCRLDLSTKAKTTTTIRPSDRTTETLLAIARENMASTRHLAHVEQLHLLGQ